MSIVIVQRSRAALYLSICGLLFMVAAVSAVSARDPSGVSMRIGMVLMTVGAGLWLPWRFLIPAALAFWLGPNYARSIIGDETFLNTNALLELPGMIGLAVFTGLARHSLRQLEDETLRVGATNEDIAGVDPETGVYDEMHLMPAIEAELARSRRFNRSFALVLVGIDSMRKRFDYRDEDTWRASFVSTARLLRRTRAKIDRVFRSGPSAFALILPEAGADEVMGLISRLRREARRVRPTEGEPGGPLPTHFGVTFFPQCATSAGDLLRRAAVTLMIAERNSNRIQLDGAAAPEPPPPETMRTEDIDEKTGAATQAITDTPATISAAEENVAVLATTTAVLGPAIATNGSTGEPEAIPLDEAVAGLMKHLDETLSYIRSLKSDGRPEQQQN